MSGHLDNQDTFYWFQVSIIHTQTHTQFCVFTRMESDIIMLVYYNVLCLVGHGSVCIFTYCKW